MKKHVTLILILFLAITQFISGQHTQFKNERRIYLWDVTLSMKGYNGAPNIYADVVEAIKNDINSIDDEETEIIVLPFQTRVLQVWKVKATPAGKAQLIKDITSFNNEDKTNTNIYTPLKEVMDKYITNDRRNVLLLLTDGDHNDPAITKSQLYQLINQWCEFALRNDAYAFYVMLTDAAEKDTELVQLIEKVCRMSTTKGTNINFVELLPAQTIKFNIKDDAGKPVKTSVICKKNIDIPQGIPIRIQAEPNEYVDINTVSELKNNTLSFDVTLKKPYQVLKEELPQEYNHKINIHLSIEDRSNKYALVSLLSENVTLELINKPEKTLKIYVVQD